MSYCTWHNYGYGIKDFDSVNWKKLEELVKSEPALYSQLLTNYNDNLDNYSSFINFLRDEEAVSDILESTYIASSTLLLLQNIIKLKHDINLAVVDDYSGQCFLILCTASPWEFNETERKLSRASLSDIFKQYCEKIDGTFDFDYWSVENGG